MTKRRQFTTPFYLGALLFFCLLAIRADAQTAGQPPAPSQRPGHDHSPHRAAANPLHEHESLAMREVTTIAVPDLVMTDQDGRRVRLYEDLMKGKLVVLNFFYTTCQGVCSTAGFWFSKLQDRLGERLGKEVVLVSISLDPEADTPEKINRWASHWKRKPGWTLLASKDEAARELTGKFLPDESAGSHSPVVFVGDGTRSRIGWISVDVVDESKALLNYFEQTKAK